MELRSTRRRAPAAAAPGRSPLWPFADESGGGADSGSGAALPGAVADAIADALGADGRRTLRLVDRAACAWHDARVRELAVKSSEYLDSTAPEGIASACGFAAAAAAGRLPSLRAIGCTIGFCATHDFRAATAALCRTLPPLAAQLEVLDLNLHYMQVSRTANLRPLARCFRALTRLTRLKLHADDLAGTEVLFGPPWPLASLQVGGAKALHGSMASCARTDVATYPARGDCSRHLSHNAPRFVSAYAPRRSLRCPGHPFPRQLPSARMRRRAPPLLR